MKKVDWLSKPLCVKNTFGDFLRPWAISSIEINLLDQLNVVQQWDERYEERVRHRLVGRRVHQVLLDRVCEQVTLDGYHDIIKVLGRDEAWNTKWYVDGI